MSCWICYEDSNIICCECDNDFKYAHDECIIEYYLISGKDICIFCNKKYKMSNLKILWYKFKKVYNHISNYNLHTMTEWDDYYDN